MLPQSVTESLRAHLERVRELHNRDLSESTGRVQLPDALSRSIQTPTANGDGTLGRSRTFHRRLNFVRHSGAQL